MDTCCFIQFHQAIRDGANNVQPGLCDIEHRIRKVILREERSSKPCTLTDGQKKLSLKTSKVIGTIYAGVAIIEGDKPYVIEINGTPSGKGIFEATGVDVTAKIVEYLLDLVT